MSERAPRTIVLEENLPASTILATTVIQLGEVSEAGVVSGATYTPAANITGADSPASRTITLINKGSDGNGTTVLGTLAYALGTNGVDFDEQAFTLSVVAGALVVAAGDVIVASSAPVGGTGLVDPGGRIRVNLDRA